MSAPFKMFLPRYRRHSSDFTMRWDDIQHEVDLPRRLFVGDLCEGSFQKTAEGWAADYKDEPFTARIEKRRDSMWFSESFNGIQKGMFVFPCSVEGAKCVNGYFRNNGMYDDLFKDAFSDLNLTYLPYQSEETAGISCSFPDASFTTVVVPLTFSKEALEGLGAVIQDLERAKIPSTGVLKSAMTVVNYLEGKCPDVPTHEVEHLEWLLLQGLLPLGMFVWEGNLEQRVLTSRRISPVLFLTIAQAYLPRTLEILVNRALVVSKTSPHKDRMAFLLHTMDTAFVKSVSNFTSDQSRRIFLPLYEDGKESTTELFAQASSDTTTIQELGQRLNSVMADFETTRDGITAKMVTLADDLIANQKGFGA